MTTLELRGRITEDGQLEIQLPAGLPAGEVTVRVEVPNISADWESQPWTAEEVRKLIAPQTRQEFLTWLEANPPLEQWGDLAANEDAGEYVHRMRRQSEIDMSDNE